MSTPPTTRTTPTTRPAQPAPAGQFQSPELNAYAQQLGSSVPTYYAPDDPPVYLGTSPWTGAGWHAPHPVDNTVPTSEAAGLIYTWDPGRLVTFQDNLVRSGMVDASDISRGARDATTVRAWQQLVGQSADAYTAGVRVSPTALLDELVAKPLTPPGQRRAPLSVTLTNPADVKQGIRDLFRESLGKGALDEQQLDGLVAQWHGVESGYQREQYAAQGAGGTVTAAPDFKTWADEQAKQIDPTAYDSHKVLEKFAVIQQMLSGEAA